MFKLLKRFGRKTDSVTEPAAATETVGLSDLDAAQTVADVFPQLRHLAVNMTIRSPDHEIEPSLTNRSFGPQSRAYFNFRCKNVECVGGGFDLREEFENAVQDKRRDVTGRRICHGWRNADTVGHQKCYYELNFKIHLSYRN